MRRCCGLNSKQQRHSPGKCYFQDKRDELFPPQDAPAGPQGAASGAEDDATGSQSGEAADDMQDAGAGAEPTPAALDAADNASDGVCEDEGDGEVVDAGDIQLEGMAEESSTHNVECDDADMEAEGAGAQSDAEPAHPPKRRRSLRVQTQEVAEAAPPTARSQQEVKDAQQQRRVEARAAVAGASRDTAMQRAARNGGKAMAEARPTKPVKGSPSARTKARRSIGRPKTPKGAAKMISDAVAKAQKAAAQVTEAAQRAAGNADEVRARKAAHIAKKMTPLPRVALLGSARGSTGVASAKSAASTGTAGAKTRTTPASSSRPFVVQRSTKPLTKIQEFSLGVRRSAPRSAGGRAPSPAVQSEQAAEAAAAALAEGRPVSAAALAAQAKRRKFDLQASLSRKLNYKPHAGKFHFGENEKPRPTKKVARVDKKAAKVKSAMGSTATRTAAAAAAKRQRSAATATARRLG